MGLVRYEGGVKYELDEGGSTKGVEKGRGAE